MPRPPEPTDPEYEANLGRVALWLSPEDLELLGARCVCTDAASDEERRQCDRIRFRAQAALHKAGVKRDSSFNQ